MIPKIIHYCWYGHGELGSEIKMCISSWRKYCPDYKIREWTEENTPMDIPWIRDAYKHQKYAFVADYMRFYVLYQYGGVYLDTDMLLIKPIEELLLNELFIGREDAYHASWGIIGSVKGNMFCKKNIDYYNSTTFDMVSPPIITCFITPILFDYGFVEEDITQQLVNGLVIYKSDYFYPIHYTQEFELENVMSYVKPNTFGVHLWNKSWTDEFQLLNQGQYKFGFKLVWARFKRTPFLPFRYWIKVIKYFGNYIGIWKR